MSTNLDIKMISPTFLIIIFLKISSPSFRRGELRKVVVMLLKDCFFDVENVFSFFLVTNQEEWGITSG